MDPLPCRQHNHERCIDSAVLNARDLCARRGVRLTHQRELVLRLIWQTHQPLGAYTLMEMLSAETTKPVAPPTVYRALDFLHRQGLIHKIHSLNAFIGCSHPGNPAHQSQFLICRQCHVAVECSGPGLDRALNETAAVAGFVTEQQSVEIVGLCPACRSDRE